MIAAAPADSRRRRVAWACRRGMLELDAILAPLASRSPTLGDDELRRAEELLEKDDYALWDMLVLGDGLTAEYAGLLGRPRRGAG